MRRTQERLFLAFQLYSRRIKGKIWFLNCTKIHCLSSFPTGKYFCGGGSQCSWLDVGGLLQGRRVGRNAGIIYSNLQQKISAQTRPDLERTGIDSWVHASHEMLVGYMSWFFKKWIIYQNVHLLHVSIVLLCDCDMVNQNAKNVAYWLRKENSGSSPPSPPLNHILGEGEPAFHILHLSLTAKKN